MADESTFLNTSQIVEKHANSVCDGVVARLAVFGIHADINVCVNAELAKLTTHINIPYMMTCAEVIAAAKILGIKADVKVCAVTNSHGKKHGKVYEKRGDEDYVSIMYNKPPIQPSTSTYPEKPYKSEYPLTPPGYPTTPDKPPVQLPAPERSRCMACKPPKPLVYPPITEKPPCKTCRPPKPPIQPLVPLPTNEKSPKPPVYLPALPHMPPTCLPTPDRPCSPKIM